MCYTWTISALDMHSTIDVKSAAILESNTGISTPINKFVEELTASIPLFNSFILELIKSEMEHASKAHHMYTSNRQLYKIISRPILNDAAGIQDVTS